MKKKELKNHINKNGFYFHITEINRLSERPAFHASVAPNDSKLEENSVRTKVELPAEDDNIIYFRGVATQEFGVGETNRNGYKIDLKGWVLDNFVKNPQIFLSHDEEEPIGKALELTTLADRMEVLYFVDLRTLNERDAHRIKSGMYAALSTGSLTLEMMWEDSESGERFTSEDIQEMGWEEFSKRDFIRVVTRSELVEISVVSIPSNPDALTAKEAIKKCFDDLENSIFKNEAPEPEEKEEEEEGEEGEEPQPEQTETPTSEGEPTPKAEDAEPVTPENGGETPSEVPATPENEEAEPAASGEEETPKEEEKVRLRIKKEDRAKLENAHEVLTEALAQTYVENEGEPEAEEPTPEAPTPEPTAPEGQKVEEEEKPKETDSLKAYEMPKVLKDAIQALVDVNVTQEKEIATLKDKLSKLPERKIMASLTNQFDAAPKEGAAKPGELAKNLLRDAGFSVE